jgi:protein-L-isoaspartate(D-aspartate) O-methyltransferase
MPEEKQYESQRLEMIEKQLRRRGVTDAAVLAAMAKVPRHEFVPVELQDRAYEDVPLPIGGGQTISQPYIVGAMTASLRLLGQEKVLEIGTGCGYQAVVLSHLAREVITIERRPDLASAAAATLTRLGCSNVHVHCGDGTLGLPELAPFDAILVAAGAPSIPRPLLMQLSDAGRMILPVGGEEQQDLQLIEKLGESFQKTMLEGCRFVPLVGHYGWQKSPKT